jgi:hypothetical protein
MAKWHSAVHTARSLKLAVGIVERLFYFAVVFHTLGKWSVAAFFAVYLHKSSWICHDIILYFLLLLLTR